MEKMDKLELDSIDGSGIFSIEAPDKDGDFYIGVDDGDFVGLYLSTNAALKLLHFLDDFLSVRGSDNGTNSRQ